MKNMKNWDSDIILYAKGWYKKTDTIEDLKKIYAKRSLINPEFIHPYDLISQVSHLAYKLGCFNDEYKFHNFFDRCFQDYPRLGYKDSVTITRMLEILLTLISSAQVKTDSGKVLIVLDKPDPDLFEIIGNVEKFEWAE